MTDLDRLFLDLRSLGKKYEVIREIGDFVAHRDERDKGVVIKRIKEMQISAKSWLRQKQNIAPTLEEARETAIANLNIVPETRLHDNLRMSKQQARTHYAKAEKKLAAGKKPVGKQEKVFNFLAGTMMWECAFSDEQLIEELAEALIETGSLDKEAKAQFLDCRDFVALYTLSVLHMSNLLMPDKNLVSLCLREMGETKTLTVKALIPVGHFKKPMFSSIPLFATQLNVAVHIDLGLEDGESIHDIPIEIGPNGKLVLLR